MIGWMNLSLKDCRHSHRPTAKKISLACSACPARHRYSPAAMLPLNTHIYSKWTRRTSKRTTRYVWMFADWAKVNGLYQQSKPEHQKDEHLSLSLSLSLTQSHSNYTTQCRCFINIAFCVELIFLSAAISWVIYLTYIFVVEGYPLLLYMCAYIYIFWWWFYDWERSMHTVCVCENCTHIHTLSLSQFYSVLCHRGALGTLSTLNAYPVNKRDRGRERVLVCMRQFKLYWCPHTIITVHKHIHTTNGSFSEFAHL